jgi:hypothetical protein
MNASAFRGGGAILAPLVREVFGNTAKGVLSKSPQVEQTKPSEGCIYMLPVRLKYELKYNDM